MATGLFTRSGVYQMRRRVPKRYASVETRREVTVSLHTDNQQIAAGKAERTWAQMLEGWEARLAGDTQEAEERFAAAEHYAQVRGFRYLAVERVAKLPVAQLVDRVEAVGTKQGRPDLFEASALLGAVDLPELTVTNALDLYWGLTREKILGKDADQTRRWRNARIKAVKAFVSVAGDKPIAEITRDDMLDFRQYWLERIEGEGITPNSANKDLIYLGSVLKTVNKLKRLGLNLPLGELSFKEGQDRCRPPFSVAWIKEKILAPGALATLNGDARGLLLGMINTGYRPSEGAVLSRNTIRLDCDVPHISIEPEGRQLKTQHARRKIPLVGVSLEAFRESPEGFPRYQNGSASLSATVNKYLRSRGLLETPEHSFYSLRHSFEDRMLEAGIDERVRRDLFGHTLNRERYGKGASLEHAARLLVAIAI
ncbi:MAG: tyrosine-type recombinase/integrase [Alphaproteobacteria bacterium]|nr:tyrosine-type recombinase/integrase [Alphaproteobacteria bacterium]